MNKTATLELIQKRKDAAVADYPNLIAWSWIKAIIEQIPDEAWESYLEQALEKM